MANTKIPSELIADSSITAAKLADGTITTADIADSNVTTAKIADSNVTTAKIGDAQVTTAKITDANVTTGKIADDAVTTAKMASNSVTSDTLASGLTLAGNTAVTGVLTVNTNAATDVLVLRRDSSNGDSGIQFANSSGNLTVIRASSVGNFTIDTAGDIYLDADGGDVVLFDGGTEFGRFEQNSNNFRIKSSASNADILFMGSNAGSAVTALTLDMSEAGKATFNSSIDVNGSEILVGGTDSRFAENNLRFNSSGTAYIDHNTVGQSILVRTSNSSSLDTSAVSIASSGAVGLSSNLSVTGTISSGAITSTGLLTLTGASILLNDSGNNEQSVRIQNSTVTGYFGVEGSSANRFSGSLANNMFLGTTTADGIEFATNNTVRATINSSGNVGIGTTTPDADLHISGTNDNNLIIQNSTYQGSGQNTEAAIRFKVTASSDAERAKAGIHFKNDGSAFGRGDLHFAVDSNDDNGNVDIADSKMVITHEGKVGIGTSTPSAALEVARGSAGYAGIFGAPQGSGKVILFKDNHASPNKYNWLVGTQYNTNNAFEITPSTVVGCYTFNAPAITVLETGSVGIGTTPTAGMLDIEGGSSGVSVRVRGDVGAGAYYYGYMFDGTDVRGTTQTNIFYSGSAIAANTTITDYAGIRIDQPNTSASGAVVTNNYAIYSSGSAQKSYFAGKVGIGTAAPDQPLHVVGADSGIKISSATSDRPYLSLFNGTSEMLRLSANSLYGAIGDSTDSQRYMVFKSGNVGIGTATPFGTTSNRTCLSVNGTSSVSLNIGVGDAQKGYLYTDGNMTQLGSVGAIPLKFAPNDGVKMTLDASGDLSISDNTVSTGIGQFQNTGITSTTSAAASWSITTDSGTYNDVGSLEVAGIANRHVYKWAFSGNLSSGTWYPFAKRSELVNYGPDTGSGSEDGFAMYFRIYIYTSSSGWGEYFSNRMTNLCWLHSASSNSNSEQHFIIGPGLGHAPNGGQGFPASGTSISPVEMRIHHRYGTGDAPNSDQTFEIKLPSAFTGLNPTVAGRQLIIYGYIL